MGGCDGVRGCEWFDCFAFICGSHGLVRGARRITSEVTTHEEIVALSHPNSRPCGLYKWARRARFPGGCERFRTRRHDRHNRD